MEDFVGFALAVLVFAAGVGLGWTFPVRDRKPPTPRESGLGSAVLLFKSTTDKVLMETAAQREFTSKILDGLLDTNDAFANKILTITDGALERMRIERDEPAPAGPAPFVDINQPDPYRQPDVSIPDRRNDHIG